jgi:hypothetical protein
MSRGTFSRIASTIFVKRQLPPKRVFVLCVLGLSSITACAPAQVIDTPIINFTLIPTPAVAITIETAGAGGPCRVQAGGTLPLVVTGVPEGNVSFSWSASAGDIAPNDRAVVLYHAPDTPQDVIIWVTALTENGGAAETMIRCEVTGLTPTPTGTFTPAPFTDTPALPSPTGTPDATQTLQAAFQEVDSQFQEALRSNIAYNAPEEMKLGETVTIQLHLNPSQSQGELATQLVERSDLPTSTAEPGQLVTDEGGEVRIETDQVAITNQMKAVLLSREPGAFEIQELHDDAEQVISGVETTRWRWSVTAREEGEHSLELVLYRLVRYGEEEHWPEVEAYAADIVVDVTMSQRIRSWNWDRITPVLLAVFTALLVPLFFRWYDARKKKAGQPKPPDRNYKSE